MTHTSLRYSTQDGVRCKLYLATVELAEKVVDDERKLRYVGQSHCHARAAPARVLGMLRWRPHND